MLFIFWNNLNDKFDLLSPLNIVFSSFHCHFILLWEWLCVRVYECLSVNCMLSQEDRKKRGKKKLLGYSSLTFLKHLFCAANALDCWLHTKLVYRVGICGKVLRNVSHLHHFCNCFFLFHFVVTHIVYSNKYFKIVWSFHRHVALLLFVKIALWHWRLLL